MVKAKLIALLLLISTVAVAQEKVNHIVYSCSSTVDTKKGPEKTTGLGVEVDVNDKQVVIKRLNEDGTLNEARGYRIYDRERKLMIYDLAKTEQYIIEKADTVVRRSVITKPTNNTAEINGYACKAYEANAGGYTYKFWVTEEILTDESINDQIVPAFTLNKVTFSFKGTLVKVEMSYSIGKQSGASVYALTKANYTEEANKVHPMPWTRKGAKALLPTVVETNGTTNTYSYSAFSYTSETPQKLHARLRALLTEVTGIEKPKFSETHLVAYLYY